MKRFGRRVHAVTYRHEADGDDYIHEFGPGVELWATEDGDALIAHPQQQVAPDPGRGRQLFLHNPPRPARRGRKMPRAAGRTQSGRIRKGYRLTKGGRVVKTGGKTRRRSTRKRKNPPTRKRTTTTAGKRTTRKRTTTRRAPARRNSPRKRATTRRRKSTTTKRRSYRRNPTMTLQKRLTDGAVGAAQVVLGKAAARAIPQALNMPQAGPQGLAIQIASAVAVGMAADQILGRTAGRMVLAGGLSAPVESMIAAAGIPFISDALGRYPTVGRYPRPATVGRYPRPAHLAGYPSNTTVPYGPAYA